MMLNRVSSLIIFFCMASCSIFKNIKIESDFLPLSSEARPVEVCGKFKPVENKKVSQEKSSNFLKNTHIFKMNTLNIFDNVMNKTCTHESCRQFHIKKFIATYKKCLHVMDKIYEKFIDSNNISKEILERLKEKYVREDTFHQDLFFMSNFYKKDFPEIYKEKEFISEDLFNLIQVHESRNGPNLKKIQKTLNSYRKELENYKKSISPVKGEKEAIKKLNKSFLEQFDLNPSIETKLKYTSPLSRSAREKIYEWIDLEIKKVEKRKYIDTKIQE